MVWFKFERKPSTQDQFLAILAILKWYYHQIDKLSFSHKKKAETMQIPKLKKKCFSSISLKVVLSPKIQIQFFTLQESPDDADSKTENRIVLSLLVLEI